MNLLVIWVGFIISISVFQKLSLLHYFFLNILMLWFIYLCNLAKPSQVSLRLFILFSTFPITVIGYVAFTYNNFLTISTY